MDWKSMSKGPLRSLRIFFSILSVVGVVISPWTRLNIVHRLRMTTIISLDLNAEIDSDLIKRQVENFYKSAPIELISDTKLEDNSH